MPNLLKAFEILEPLLISALVGCAVFTALALIPRVQCNPGRSWWNNRGLATDACYFLFMPFITPYLRLFILILGSILLWGFMTSEEIMRYLAEGRGPLGGTSWIVQSIVYVVGSDFLLYWSHRLFHGATMWRYHAIHHSADDVQWTTAHRFHPINLMLGPSLVSGFMLYLGISPAVLLFWSPFDTATAWFVHSNLNCNLGPLKYVFANPIFHRWHHTGPDEGGSSNFAPLFAFWDVLFGTFYMPDGKLPENYGVDDHEFPTVFLGQMLYPVRHIFGARTSSDVTSSRPANS